MKQSSLMRSPASLRGLESTAHAAAECCFQAKQHVTIEDTRPHSAKLGHIGRNIVRFGACVYYLCSVVFASMNPLADLGGVLRVLKEPSSLKVPTYILAKLVHCLLDFGFSTTFCAQLRYPPHSQQACSVEMQPHPLMSYL